MACRWGMSWILIAVVIFIPVAFFITYIIGWQLGHVRPVLPFISETGRGQPESHIFAQLLNIGALCMAVTMYVRYRQVGEYLLTSSSRRAERVNKASLVSGLIASLSTTLVANFPLSDIAAVLWVHNISSFLAFGLCIIYCWLTVALSFTTVRQLSSVFVCWLRVVLAFIATATFIFTNIGAYFGLQKGLVKWLPPAAACQWILLTSLMLCLMTFFDEFRYVVVKATVKVTDRRTGQRLLTVEPSELML